MINIPGLQGTKSAPVLLASIAGVSLLFVSGSSHGSAA